MDGDRQLILISFKTFYEQLRIIQFEDIAVGTLVSGKEDIPPRREGRTLEPKTFEP
jgi:hypothetical protein